MWFLVLFILGTSCHKNSDVTLVYDDRLGGVSEDSASGSPDCFQLFLVVDVIPRYDKGVNMNKEFFPKTLDLPIEMTDDEHNVESEEEVDELSQDKVSDQHTNKYDLEGEMLV